MSDRIGQAKLFASLLALWVALNGSLAPATFAVGLVVAALVSWAMGASLSVLSGYRFSTESLIATLGYLGFFLKALVRANLRMAVLVLTPRMPIRPAIVRVETRLTHPVARLLLANSITLTPGTLTVEMAKDALYVHWVEAESTDPQVATDEIVAGFERYLEVMYG